MNIKYRNKYLRNLQLKTLIFSLLILFSVVIQPNYGRGEVFSENLQKEILVQPISSEKIDFDGDNISDSVINISTAHSLKYKINLSKNSDSQHIDLSNVVGNAVIFAYDIDSDGDSDIVANLLSQNSSLIWLNNGNGQFDFIKEFSSLFSNNQSYSKNLHFLAPYLANPPNQHFQFFTASLFRVFSSDAKLITVSKNLADFSFSGSYILRSIFHSISRRGPPFI